MYEHVDIAWQSVHYGYIYSTKSEGWSPKGEGLYKLYSMQRPCYTMAIIHNSHVTCTYPKGGPNGH